MKFLGALISTIAVVAVLIAIALVLIGATL